MDSYSSSEILSDCRTIKRHIIAMKKKHIYREFDRIAKDVVGDCRRAQRYYVMQMCEQLGKVDHRLPFVMWCSKKRVLAFQYDNAATPTQIGRGRGKWYLFPKSGESAECVDITEPIKD